MDRSLDQSGAVCLITIFFWHSLEIKAPLSYDFLYFGTPYTITYSVRNVIKVRGWCFYRFLPPASCFFCPLQSKCSGLMIGFYFVDFAWNVFKFLLTSFFCLSGSILLFWLKLRNARILLRRYAFCLARDFENAERSELRIVVVLALWSGNLPKRGPIGGWAFSPRISGRWMFGWCCCLWKAAVKLNEIRVGGSFFYLLSVFHDLAWYLVRLPW